MLNTDFSMTFLNYLKIKNTDKIQVNVTEGLGLGLLYPKTNTTLLGKERHDDFFRCFYSVLHLKQD
jgi:hypothetical protein